MAESASNCEENIQFLIFSDEKSFDNASVECKGLDDSGSLAIVSSLEINEKVRSLLQELDLDNLSYWFGLNNNIEDDLSGNNPLRFDFVDGIDRDKSFFSERGEFPWFDNRPNGGNGIQDCIFYRRNTFLWDDSDCSRKKSYICQINCNEENENDLENEDGNLIIYILFGFCMCALFLIIFLVVFLKKIARKQRFKSLSEESKILQSSKESKISYVEINYKNHDGEYKHQHKPSPELEAELQVSGNKKDRPWTLATHSTPY